MSLLQEEKVHKFHLISDWYIELRMEHILIINIVFNLLSSATFYYTQKGGHAYFSILNFLGWHKVMESIDHALELGYNPVKVWNLQRFH